MEICKTTNLECCECTPCCKSRVNENQVAINILGYATDLVRAIEYSDKTYISANIDSLIDMCEYFKDVFIADM